MFGIAHARTYSIVKLLPEVDLWVMNKNTTSLKSYAMISEEEQFKIDNISGVQDSYFFLLGRKEFSSLRKRSIEANVIGISKNAPFALPAEFIKGKGKNLAYRTGIFIDSATAKRLSLKLGSRLKTGKITSTVVGIFSCPKTISSTPLIITTLDWAKYLTRNDQRTSPFLLIKKKEHADTAALKKQINQMDKLIAYDQGEFKKLILSNIVKETGLPSAFTSVVICGLILAIGIILSQISAATNLSSQELTLYRTLGGSKLVLFGLALSYGLTAVFSAMVLALFYHIIMLATFPPGAFVFAPNGEIIALTLFISIVSACAVASFKVHSIRNTGATAT